MNQYKIIFYYKESGMDFFIIMQQGKCVYKNRRDVIFPSEKGLKKGDAYLIESIPEDLQSKQNPFFKKIKIINCDKFDRLNNLLDATLFIIEELFSTQEEIKQNKFLLNNGIYFVEYGYFMRINELFESIISYFNSEKKYNYSKKVKIIADEFYESRYKLLGIKKGDDTSFYGEYNDPVEFLKITKKEKFSIFTPKQEIATYIHNTIKSEAKEKFNLIKQICNEFILGETNEQFKN